MAPQSPKHGDLLGRRNRFRRQPSGKQLRLTDRDHTILRWLYRYRYLTKNHLLTTFEPQSPKRFTERMGDLFHETKLLNRVSLPSHQFDRHCTPLIYEISQTGISYLEQNIGLPNRAVTFSRRGSRATGPQFAHTLFIIETLLSIELATMRTPNERFVSVDEILSRSPEATQQMRNPLRIPVTLQPRSDMPFIKRRQDAHVIPDALYGIEYEIDGEKRYRFWALECERTNPKYRSSAEATSTRLKQASYDALINTKTFKKRWGIPNLRLRVVGKTE